MKLTESILLTGVISTAVPVKKTSWQFEIKLGFKCFSTTLILFFFAISITVCLVIPLRKQSAKGVYKSPSLTKNRDLMQRLEIQEKMHHIQFH